MPTITHSDYLAQVSGSGLVALPGLWVRLRNNSTSTDYFSTAVSDAQGAFTHSAVPGDYSAYTGTAATVVGTPTLRNAHYAVPVTAGDDAVLGSATLVVSSPYVATLPGDATTPTPAGVTTGKVWDWAGVSYNVLASGAKGDGVTLDGAKIDLAIAAAEAKADTFNPVKTGSAVSFGIGVFLTNGGHTCRRSMKWIGAPGAIVKLNSSSATLVTFGKDTDTGWIPGGIDGVSLIGQGGGADTSIGLQIGSGANNVQGIQFWGMDIRDFGNGVVVTGTGSNFAWTFDLCRIHNNAFNGIRYDAAGNNETATFHNTHVFNNGLGQSTGTAFQVMAGASGNLRLGASQIDNNGNGTLGQIQCAATGRVTFTIYDCHFEHAGGADCPHVNILTTAVTGRSTVMAVNTDFNQNPGALNNKTLFIWTGDLYLTNCVVNSQAGAAQTTVFDIGASTGGVSCDLLTRNCNFTLLSSGTPANGRLITVSGTPSQTTIDVAGSLVFQWSTATNFLNLVAGGVYAHDLYVNASGASAQRTLRRVIQPVVTLAFVNGSMTPDASLGSFFQVTLTAGSGVIQAPTNRANGQVLTYTIIQDGTGGWALGWGAAYKQSWSNTGNTLNKRSTISFYDDGTNLNQIGAQTPYV